VELSVTDTVVSIADVTGKKQVEFTTSGRFIRERPIDIVDGARRHELGPDLRLIVINPPTRTVLGGTNAAVPKEPYFTLVVEHIRERTRDTLAKIRAGLPVQARVVTTFTIDGRGRKLTGDTVAKRADLAVPESHEAAPLASYGRRPGGAWALLGDSLLAVVNGDSGAVRVYAVGARGLTLRLTATVGTRAEADRRRSNADDVHRWPDATSAFFTADGSLWVGRSPEDPRGNIWTVYPRQLPSYSVRVPAGFVLTAARDNKVFGYDFSPQNGWEVRVLTVQTEK